MPALTLIITTRNHFELTRLCVESILWSLPPETYELIIVDDGSSDQTLRLGEHFRFLKTERPGIYGAWNVGVMAAQTEYVGVLNNDLFFCMRNWWPRMAAVFETTSVGWLFPHTIETQSAVKNLYGIVSAAEHEPGPSFESRYGDVEACCFFIRRSLFETVGPFDDRFKIWYGEKDYEIRMAQQEIPYGRVRNVVARHFGSSTLGLAAQGDFDPQVLNSEREMFAKHTAEDRALFCSKYAESDLTSLGLRIPPFAPGPLGLGM